MPKDIIYSIVLPAYNESMIISSSIDRVHSFFRSLKKPFEIIVADDGSSDNTSDIVRSKMKKFKELKLFSNDKNQGKGSVLSGSLPLAKGRIVAFIDSDLAIDINLFNEMIKSIDDGFDIVIASKHLKNSEVEYSFLRSVFSHCYAFTARIVLGVDIKDYQCGFKAFNKKVLSSVLPLVKSKSWSWDTEFLVKASWLGFRIKELPAKVVDVGRKSKVHPFRDTKNFGLELFKLFKEKKSFRK
ncbi:MAG: glycosyltransferase [Nanoarchaeota archaeon]|mgnify:CR=1 FL=1